MCRMTIDMRKFCYEYGYTLIEIPFTADEDINGMLAKALRKILISWKCKGYRIPKD